jgi:hypothetical protein
LGLKKAHLENPPEPLAKPFAEPPELDRKPRTPQECSEGGCLVKAFNA